MGVYKWSGLDKEGRPGEGVVQASNMREARRILRTKKIRAKRIIAPSLLELDLNEWMLSKGLIAPFGSKELIEFTRNMAIMIDASLPILMSLEILYKSEKNSALKVALKQIAQDIAEGQTFSGSLFKQKGFPKLYCNLIKAGEVGGILDVILNKLAEHMDKIDKIKSQIKAALTYPLIIIVVGVCVIWGLVTFVVPQFADMVKSGGNELPWITQFVMDASEFTGSYSIFIIPAGIIFGVIFKSWRNTPVGKWNCDFVLLKLPLFKEIVIKGNLGSFSRTLSTLLAAGVPLIDALEICIETIENKVIANDIIEVKEKVIKGKTLVEPLSKIDYFPDMIIQMVKIGEKTGALDEMLDKVANIFEDQISKSIASVTSLIEPLILVVLGGCVAFILLAIYLPMFMGAGG